MSEYPSMLVDSVSSLPSSVDQTELNNKGLFVVQGLDRGLAKQLVLASRQSHIDRFCDGDATSRFYDLEHIITWQAKGRLALPLVRHTGEGNLKISRVWVDGA